ncbi:hypothetical protein [Halodesulfovibrio aestuarii]|uniref:hypothetical protein n=1 Tax=Halodesulfovibrio aestuarii TaxID=126333 RepID=UPI003D34A378
MDKLTPSPNIVFNNNEAVDKVGSRFAKRVTIISEENAFFFNLTIQDSHDLSAETQKDNEHSRKIFLGLENFNVVTNALNYGKPEVSVAYSRNSSEIDLKDFKSNQSSH